MRLCPTWPRFQAGRKGVLQDIGSAMHGARPRDTDADPRHLAATSEDPTGPLHRNTEQQGLRLQIAVAYQNVMLITVLHDRHIFYI